ncbi:MAG: hypothetical protein KAJ51_17890 [Thermoplasmata archaeon]|nr:hypothetical protein [Thermoplasmata archaeon]
MQESEESQELLLDHFVYGSDQGYKVKAWSSGVDEDAHTDPFDGCFIPMTQADAKYVTDARSIIPAGDKYILLSRFIKGSIDEYQRKTMANHTALVPRKYLIEGKLTYEDVDQAMQKYEAATENPRKEIRQLKLQSRSVKIDVGELKNYFIRDDVEKLMNFYKQDHANKVFIYYKKSSAEQRNEAAYLLSMLVDIGLNLVPLSIFTDVPYPEAKRVFNLILARSMISIKPGKGWSMLPTQAIPMRGDLQREGKDPLDSIFGDK